MTVESATIFSLRRLQKYTSSCLMIGFRTNSHGSHVGIRNGASTFQVICFGLDYDLGQIGVIRTFARASIQRPPRTSVILTYFGCLHGRCFRFLQRSATLPKSSWTRSSRQDHLGLATSRLSTFTNLDFDMQSHLLQKFNIPFRTAAPDWRIISGSMFRLPGARDQRPRYLHLLRR